MPRTIAPPDFASSVATNDGGMPRIDVRRDSAASTVYSADGGGDGGGPLSSYAGAAQRRRSSTYTVLSENASDVAGYEYAGATAAVEAHRLLQQRHGGDVAAADGDPDMGLAQANNRREVEYDNNRVLPSPTRPGASAFSSTARTPTPCRGSRSPSCAGRCARSTARGARI